MSDISNNLHIYNTLNSVKPSYFQTSFPFNAMSPNKIKLVTGKIKLLVKNMSIKHTEKSGGGTGDPPREPIVMYG